MASTDVEKAGSNLPEGIDGLDGLEDVGAGDVLLPIIRIDHPEGEFVDSLSNERFTEFECIMLGLVKQRVLWPSEVGEEGKQPLCRALDFDHGRPSDDFIEEDPSGEKPANVSKFKKSIVLTAIEEAAKGPSADLSSLLPCGNCNLKEWETTPGAKTPWCSEQFIFPVLRITEDGGLAPAYIAFQRASLKACKAYISAFRQSQRPMYTVRTKIKAIPQKRGNVKYVTPEFSKLGPTDAEDWPEYSENFHDIRDFLRTPRVRDDDDTTSRDDDDDDATEDEDVIDTTATDADDEPAAEPAAAADDDDDEDDEPF